MFEKSLADMVKGLRAAKASDDLGKYVSDTMAEIKKELRSSEASTKTIAVSKLTYLNMMGYDTTWAAFNIVEVMSLSRFAFKRKGYLAAAQCFTSNTDLVLLCTNLLQKELQSKNPYAIGLAVNCLANIANKDLARVLLNDLIVMMTSSRVYIRKKAVLVMYKLFMVYPQGLRTAYPALKRKLQDEDPSVVSCAVNVVCELACKRPKNYLNLAPALFKLLQDSSNNWMLIKIVKLFSNLMSEEPRLARKLMGPLCQIIQQTDAKSLMYECVSTVIHGLPHVRKADGSNDKNIQDIVVLCSSKLREFVQEKDQNLKYLGLVGFSTLMTFSKQAVTEERGLVLQCLSDEDTTIRIRALDLLAGMVTQRNLVPIVQRLMEHIDDSEGVYRNELISKILKICSAERYSYVSNFAWYVGVLVDLARTTDHGFGADISAQLIDVVTRVEGVRAYAVQLMIPLLMDGKLLADRLSTRSSSNVDVLFATSWIIGEYAPLLMRVDEKKGADEMAELSQEEAAQVASERNENASLHDEISMAMLQTRNLTLPMLVQCAFVHNALKVVLAGLRVCACADDKSLGTEFVGAAEKMTNIVVDALEVFTESKHVEVQERAVLARTVLQQCQLCRQSTVAKEAEEPMLEFVATRAMLDDAIAMIGPMFAEPLRPVNPKAQDMVPIPEDLDLDVWIDADEKAMEESGGVGNTFVDAIAFDARTHSLVSNNGAGNFGTSGSVSKEWKFMEDDEDGDILEDLEGGGSGTPRTGSSGRNSARRKKGSYSGNSRAHASGNAFYLGGGSGGSRFEDDMDDIPMGVFSPSDDKNTPSSRRTSGVGNNNNNNNSGRRSYSIMMEDELPEGVDLSSLTTTTQSQNDSGRHRDSNASDLDLSDIDLSKPDGGKGSNGGSSSRGGGGSGRNHGGRGRGRKRVDEESDDEDDDNNNDDKHQKKDKKKKKKEKKAKKKKEKKDKTKARDDERPAPKNAGGGDGGFGDIIDVVGAPEKKKEKKSKVKKEKKQKKEKKKSKE